MAHLDLRARDEKPMSWVHNRLRQVRDQETRKRIRDNRIRRMREVGYPYAEIAQAMGLDENTVRDVLRPRSR
jgi:DNA-binding CsgD family transcriptional regulator